MKLEAFRVNLIALLFFIAIIGLVLMFIFWEIGKIVALWKYIFG
jgi:hypothetical protein